MQKHNLQPATIETTTMLKKSCCAAYQCYRTYLDEAKKQVDQSKQILDKEIKGVEGKINHLMESLKALDKTFVELVKDVENHSSQSLMIEEPNAIKRKTESQSSHCETLKQTLEVLKSKRHKS